MKAARLLGSAFASIISRGSSVFGAGSRTAGRAAHLVLAHHRDRVVVVAARAERVARVRTPDVRADGHRVPTARPSRT